MSDSWHVIHEDDLLHALRRCEAGESADIVMAEVYVNAEREQVTGPPCPHPRDWLVHDRDDRLVCVICDEHPGGTG